MYIITTGIYLHDQKNILDSIDLIIYQSIRIDLPKMGPTHRAGGKWLIHVTKHYKDNW